MKLTKDLLNNIFQDSFNKISSKQLTYDISYISIKFPDRINKTAGRGCETKCTIFCTDRLICSEGAYNNYNSYLRPLLDQPEVNV